MSATVAMVAAACLDFFFLPPLLSWRIADPLNVLAFVVFVAIALVLTHLVSQLRAEPWVGYRFRDPSDPDAVPPSDADDAENE